MEEKFLSSLKALTKSRHELIKSQDIQKLMPEISKETLYDIATKLHNQNLVVMECSGLEFRVMILEK